MLTHKCTCNFQLIKTNQKVIFIFYYYFLCELQNSMISHSTLLIDIYAESIKPFQQYNECKSFSEETHSYMKILILPFLRNIDIKFDWPGIKSFGVTLTRLWAAFRCFRSVSMVSKQISGLILDDSFTWLSCAFINPSHSCSDRNSS